MERLLAKDAPKDRDLARSAGVAFEEDEIVPGCTQRSRIKSLIPNDVHAPFRPGSARPSRLGRGMPVPRLKPMRKRAKAGFSGESASSQV